MNREDAYFCAHLESMIAAVRQKDYPMFTAFLDLHEQALAQRVCQKEHFFAARLEGVCNDAERQMLGLAPSYLPPEELSFPIAVVRVEWPKRFALTHRDLLGSLMALGVKREVLGDILLEEGCAELMVQEHLAEMVCREMQKIGRVGVTCSVVDALSLSLSKKFIPIEGTVASFRLDALLSLALRLSRQKASDLIRQGKISVNGVECESASMMLKPGDRISARGFGKYEFSNEIGTTRKDRIHVVIRKYS